MNNFMMLKNRLFSIVAVLGMLSAIASPTKGQELPIAQQSIKTVPLAIASSMPSHSLAKAPTQPHRPPNGFEMIPTQNSQGHGTLTIDNDTDQDGAVKLIDNSSQKILRFVYVQAHHKVLLKKISSCYCSVRFTLGKDWDKTKRKFLQNPSFLQFLEPLDFNEYSTFDFNNSSGDTKIYYHDITITLHRKRGGNAPTKQLSEQDF